MHVRSTVYKDNKIGGIWEGEREILLELDLIIPIKGGVRATFVKPVEFDQFGKKKQRSAIFSFAT